MTEKTGSAASSASDDSAVENSNGDVIEGPDDVAKEIAAVDKATADKADADAKLAQDKLDAANANAPKPKTVEVEEISPTKVPGITSVETVVPKVSAEIKAAQKSGVYTAKPGESIGEIANKFGIGVSTLLELNGFYPGTAGDISGREIKLYDQVVKS